jgi:hypothetical protein
MIWDLSRSEKSNPENITTPMLQEEHHSSSPMALPEVMVALDGATAKLLEQCTCPF